VSTDRSLIKRILCCKNAEDEVIIIISSSMIIIFIDQIYASTNNREKIYNKHQDTIDMQIIKRSLVCGSQNKL